MQQVYQTTIFDFYHQPILNKYETTTIFEAFSGIGTFSMALKRLGYPYEIVGFSEVDSYAIKSYRAIHGDELKNYGDVSKIKEIPKCDICTWGFPCQDVSNSGQRKGMIEGTKSNYGYSFLETLKQSDHKPKVLVMENVFGLLSRLFIKDFKTILRTLKSLGYENHFRILSAQDYGVPQNRKRVFIVSILGGGFYNFPRKIGLQKNLLDYLEDDVDPSYFLTRKQLKPILSHHQDITNPKEDRFYINENSKKGYKEAYHGDGVYIDRPATKRGVVKSQMIPTIKTSGYDVGVAIITDKQKGIRRLTPLESWRLMGIDDEDFYKAQSVVSNTRLYRQSGNAVVVNVLVELFRNLY